MCLGSTLPALHCDRALPSGSSTYTRFRKAMDDHCHSFLSVLSKRQLYCELAMKSSNRLYHEMAISERSYEVPHISANRVG